MAQSAAKTATRVSLLHVWKFAISRGATNDRDCRIDHEPKCLEEAKRLMENDTFVKNDSEDDVMFLFFRNIN